ncbi:cbb3-type cytochrome c oxidase N-terminal domain-containing protein [Blattabacterium cuenoti]|uniref:cbb3-type cytochrome c oxidase N-terminal domain-containing protein n=1 Tax=Blattabacterium cuenoti TaxID=1653831 RepID=UPI00163C1D76|nr:cbb3-type cytochrome c oxidase N-terminal domain-containing protein [Blattabacterium cuenoti]
MRSKISSLIMIPSSFSIIIFMSYVFFQSYNQLLYITHPITILFFFIIVILLIILEFINNLIFKKKIESIPEKTRKNILDKNDGNYFYSIYRFIFHDPKKYNDKIKKIDHGFDGILELDNDIPIWWLHLFYITIAISIIYFFSFIFLDYSNPYREYKTAYKEQLKKIEIFEKKKPQASIENSYFKKELIEDGKILFKENCSTCHQSDGSGNIGPNLTDNYWINTVEKDLYKNIFSIIWNGSEKNPTMRAFGKSGEIKGNDIEKISSYVYFINQNLKKPLKQKKPQGKEILEWKHSK